MENICINCKRCVNSLEWHCPWSIEYTPIKDWDAKPGKYYSIKNSEGQYEVTRGYNIKQCPLFVKDQKYLNISDVFKDISDYYGVTINFIKQKWQRYFDLYEKDTKTKLPQWVWYWKVDKQI